MYFVLGNETVPASRSGRLCTAPHGSATVCIQSSSSISSASSLSLCSTELSKPASSLYLHNLTAVLESAVRATNAQYDDQDVLNRLDVKMLDVSSLTTRDL